jgi:hypothetical protein
MITQSRHGQELLTHSVSSHFFFPSDTYFYLYPLFLYLPHTDEDTALSNWLICVFMAPNQGNETEESSAILLKEERAINIYMK